MKADPSPVPSVTPIERPSPSALPAHHSPMRKALASLMNETSVGLTPTAALSSARKSAPYSASSFATPRIREIPRA
jgi:hypothetical protein